MNEYNNVFEQEQEEDLSGNYVVEYDITSSPRDLTPASIVDMIDSGIMEIPLFQRNYIWDIKKASRLIESLILGLPVPELFFYSEGDENSTYKIIDGQQRLLSIYFFLKGRFPKNPNSRIYITRKLTDGAALDSLLPDNNIFQDFVLKLNNDDDKIISPYHGEKFSSLEKETQIKFRLRRYLRTVVVRQNKPDNNNSSMFEIFNRLNTGGTPLYPQEVRASLYYCNFYKKLVLLNELPQWRHILGNPIGDLHSLDIELILRGFALLEDANTYAPKMGTFLNNYSEKSKLFDSEHISYLGDLFESFLSACGLLQDKAFYRNKRLSRPFFEAVFCAVCKSAYANKQLVCGQIAPESFDLLKNDNEFISYLQAGSSSTDSVKERIRIATERIELKE